MRRMTMGMAALAVFLMAPSSWSSECVGITMPDSIVVEQTPLFLNGLGLRQATFLKVDVYVAGLYLPVKSANPDEIIRLNKPRRLILHFVRDVGRDKIVEAWSEGFKANAPTQLAALQARIQTFNSWMGDIRDGQEMIFTALPGRGVQVEIGGAAKGTIAGDDFASALFSIWLGAHPPNAALKTGLLGGKCE